MIDISQCLHNAIAAVCPIDGVAVLDADKHQVRVDYRAGATSEQASAAQAIIDGFDWSESAQKSLDAQTRAAILAADPVLHYVLGQLKQAVPAYAVPDKQAIAADPVLLNAVNGK